MTAAPNPDADRQRQVSILRWRYDDAVAAYARAMAVLEEIRTELELLGEEP